LGCPRWIAESLPCVLPDPPCLLGWVGCRGPSGSGDPLIVAALPDLAGIDRGHELLTLPNTTAARSSWPAEP
jgi:hypothetical protein